MRWHCKFFQVCAIFATFLFLHMQPAFRFVARIILESEICWKMYASINNCFIGVRVKFRYSAEGCCSSISSVYSNDLTHQQLAYLDTSRTPAHQAALLFTSRGLDRPTLPAHRVQPSPNQYCLTIDLLSLLITEYW